MNMMKVSVMRDIETMGWEERPVPLPHADQVLVRIGAVGVCGSDLHYYEHGRIGNFIVETPFVLGHEAAGTVVSLGKDVKHLKVGDRVALEPGIACGHCEACLSGKYNLCPDVKFFATPPVGGVFQEFVAHDARLCFKLPENMSLVEGALIEPFAVGLHTANQGGAGLGQTAVVFGAGCIGLMSLLALKAQGVSRIFVTDTIDRRLAKASELGATAIFNPAQIDIVQKINEMTDGRGCDLVIETSGAEAAAQNAIYIARRGGKIVFVGYSPSGNVTIPLGRALDKELSFETVFRYRNIYPMAIDAVSSGRADIASVVTNEFSFSEIPEAMARSCHEKAAIVKSVVLF